jgi:hypothetical protein
MDPLPLLADPAADELLCEWGVLTGTGAGSGEFAVRSGLVL